jgi:multiple sugar transport system permease protein
MAQSPDASGRPGSSSPAGLPLETWSEWFDRHSRIVFIAPAVTLILIFSIFPTVASIVIAVSRIRFSSGGFQVRFVGLQNFEKQFLSNEQVHFLGRLDGMSLIGWIFSLVVIAAILWWLVNWASRDFNIVGLLGRLISAGMAVGVALLFGATFLSGSAWGTLWNTLFFVIVGCAAQFLIGTGLAFLCAQPIAGKSFFRVLFFIPMMITPLGVGYAFRMLADTSKGPFQPLWDWVGLGNFAWAANPWTARLFIVIGDSWQWIPFIFIVMLAALENIPRDHIEAAEVDGAGTWLTFKDIVWPQIVPVAATVMLIRTIEAFKIVDLNNIMTGGGPGIATESMSLHSFLAWRSNDYGQSAAIAYLLLFVTVVTCASFFNYVVLKQLRKVA